ncbi:hypothetical protein [Brevibacillus choshinensis]|uniref:hypothetical protein n=1 Tax=Brevibacillus choshinensis TaxID=54911 RepID=UPI002E23908F|nr:hypothetical protein [Brevibacillus choshinensis]MED4781169.1 hypothetical protein [Brevibacillus choshinensis]
MSDKDRNELQEKERSSLPSGRARDLIDQAMVGSPHELLRGGCLSNFITLLAIVLGLLLLARCSHS